MESAAGASVDVDVKSILRQLNLLGFLEKLKGLGVASLSDLKLLQLADLEEIGFNRVQARKLQAELESPSVPCRQSSTHAGVAPVSTSSSNENKRPAETGFERPSMANRTASARGRARSVSFCASVRSASSNHGLGLEEFERRSTNAIEWFAKDTGRGREIAARKLGLKEADLVIDVRRDTALVNLLPPSFKLCGAKNLEQSAIRRGDVVIFEAKTSARGVRRAITQLRDRKHFVQAQLEALSRADSEPAQIVVHMAAVIAVDPNDNSSNEAVEERAADPDNSDIHIFTVAPDALEAGSKSSNVGGGSNSNHGKGSGTTSSCADDHKIPARGRWVAASAAANSNEAGNGPTNELDAGARGRWVAASTATSSNEAGKGPSNERHAGAMGKSGNGGRRKGKEHDAKAAGKSSDGGRRKGKELDEKSAGKSSDGGQGKGSKGKAADAKAVGGSSATGTGKGKDGGKGKMPSPEEFERLPRDEREKLLADWLRKRDQQGRRHFGDKQYWGEVDIVCCVGNFGWIVPQNPEELPPEVRELMTNMTAEHRARVQEKATQKQKKKKRRKPYEFAQDVLYFSIYDFKNLSEGIPELEEGTWVSFKVYVDPKGAGACDIFAFR